MKYKLIFLAVLVLCLGKIKGQSHNVGDLFTFPDGSQGVVFYNNPDGTGGWVMALNDASAGCAWGNTTDLPELNNYSYSSRHLLEDTSGYTNTQMLRSYQNNNLSYAAGVVDFANGWYLPSSAQLRAICCKLPLLSAAIVAAGGTDLAYDYYRSSTENSANSAWMINFNNNSSGFGSFGFGSKTGMRHVRAVRSFSFSPSYEWNTGETTPSISVNPTQTSNYTVTVTAASGESDIATTTIVVLIRDSLEIHESACDEFVWDGISYYGSGTFIRNYERPGACDSVVTLHLLFEHTPNAGIQSSADTVCANEIVNLQAVSASSMQQLPPVVIGDILCTDNSIVKPADWPVQGKTAMGVVFYVDDTGEHGWAVHLSEQSTSTSWGGYGINIQTLPDYQHARDAIYDYDGYLHTQQIRAAGNSSQYPAAWIVDFDNGWYLPSIGQLRKLFSAYTITNSTLNLLNSTPFVLDLYVSYWSSSEYDGNTAWRLYGGGSMTLSGKNATIYKVRSIRSF